MQIFSLFVSPKVPILYVLFETLFVTNALSFIFTKQTIELPPRYVFQSSDEQLPGEKKHKTIANGTSWFNTNIIFVLSRKTDREWKSSSRKNNGRGGRVLDSIGFNTLKYSSIG